MKSVEKNSELAGNPCYLHRNGYSRISNFLSLLYYGVSYTYFKSDSIFSAQLQYVVTDDMTQNDTSVVREVCGIRRKAELFHRETGQLTGIEGCGCRKSRIVRNHIGCPVSVRVCL